MEFESSGLRQNEFCRKHGLALSTVQRQLKRRPLDKGEAKEGSRLVAVELAENDRMGLVGWPLDWKSCRPADDGSKCAGILILKHCVAWFGCLRRSRPCWDWDQRVVSKS